METDFFPDFVAGVTTDLNDTCVYYDFDDIIGAGDFNSKVYRGSISNKEIYVKKLPGIHIGGLKINEDIATLKSSRKHINILAYIASKRIDRDIFLAMEICDTNLEVCLKEKSLLLDKLDVIKQVAEGLRHLHENRVVHGNLKPSNILISSEKCIKLSDFGMLNIYSELMNNFLKSKLHVGVIDWAAPEILRSLQKKGSAPQQSYQSDMFSLGCIFYFVVSNQIHPFGDIVERHLNILQNQQNLNQEQIDPVDRHTLPFISLMISGEIDERPSASALIHSFNFWNSDQTAEFLKSLHKLTSSSQKAIHVMTELNVALQGSDISSWGERVDRRIISRLRRDQLPCTGGVMELLSSLLHLSDINSGRPLELKEQIDPIKYFKSRLPYFLPLLWTSFQNFLNVQGIGTYYHKCQLLSYSNFLLERYPGLRNINKAETHDNIGIEGPTTSVLNATPNTKDQSIQTEITSDSLVNVPPEITDQPIESEITTTSLFNTPANIKKAPVLVFMGLAGAGKSCMIDSWFFPRTKAMEDDSRSATKSILEYQVESVTWLGSIPKKLFLIDTPGIFGTENFDEKYSMILATLEHYLVNHHKLSTHYPIAVILVVDITDHKIFNERSHFIRLLQAVQHLSENGTLIDKDSKTCNLIVVLTHIMNADEELQTFPEPCIRFMQGLIKTFTTISTYVPVVLAENLAKEFNLETRDESFLLPNGDFYPINLFRTIVQNAKNDRIKRILVDVFTKTWQMRKRKISEQIIFRDTSDISREYRIAIKYIRFGLEKSEMTKRLDEVWNALPNHETRTKTVLLHIAKAILIKSGIDSPSKIPMDSVVLLELLRQLPLNSTLVQVLLDMGISPPNLLDHCKSVGSFYNPKNNSIKDSPLLADTEIITYIGFLAPEFVSAFAVNKENIETFVGVEVHTSQNIYNLDRSSKLKLEFHESITKFDIPVASGHNVVHGDGKPRRLSGIREFREYSVYLKGDPKFTPAYIEALKKIPSYTSWSAQEWTDHFADFGTHILNSAYLGGSITITAIKKVGVSPSTSVEDVMKKLHLS